MSQRRQLNVPPGRAIVRPPKESYERTVYILGGGLTDFKRKLKKEGKTICDLITESGHTAIDDAKVDPAEVEAAAVGNFNAGQFTQQLPLGTAPDYHIEKLRAKWLITQEQFDEFTNKGAIGSHLENLQRKGGFKGFNQHAVSIIIAETDPRLQKSQ